MAMLATSVTGSRGFTLLELLVVLAVLVLITCAWPVASSHVFVTQHLRNELQQLAGRIRLAQMNARMTGTAQELRISEHGDQYRVGSQEHQLPSGSTLKMDSGSSSTLRGRLLFLPDGSSSGGLLTLTLQQHTASLKLLPATGRLELIP
jgi:type II secretion system protein H